MGVADGSGEGDCPAVEKFEPTGLLLGDGLLIGTGAAWGRIVVTLAGAAAAAACAAAFVFAVVVAPVRRFVPICVVPVVLPLELPSPPAAPPAIPPVELLIPVCAPAFIPMRAPTFKVGPVIGTTPEICSSLNGAGGVQAAKSRSGAADDAAGWIADPGLRCSIHPDVCCGIRV